MAVTGRRGVERGCFRAAMLVVGGTAATFGYLLLASPARAADPLPGPLSGVLPAVTRVGPVAPLAVTVLEPVRRWPLHPVTSRVTGLVAGPAAPALTGPIARRPAPGGPATPPARTAAEVRRWHRPPDAVGLSLPDSAAQNSPVGGPVPPSGPVTSGPARLWWPVISSRALSATGSAGSVNELPLAPGWVRRSGVLAVPTRCVAAWPDEPRLPRGPPRRPGFRPD